MGSVDVSELITRAQQAADMEDDFISQSTWLYWANVEHKKLWIKLARSGFPIGYNETPITITGALQYNTDESLAIIGMRGITRSGRYFRVPIVHPINMTGINSTVTGRAQQCMISHDPGNVGNEIVIRFWPTPQPNTDFYTLATIVYPKTLVLDTPSGDESDTVNFPNGWEERIVLGMARRALGKEETINPAIEAEIREVDNDIENSVRSYLLVDNATVHDVNEPTPGTLPPYTDWLYL